jgi:hypothetical protein
MTQELRDKILLHHLGRVRALKVDVDAGMSFGTLTITVSVTGNEAPALLQALGEHIQAPPSPPKAGTFVPVEGLKFEPR